MKMAAGKFKAECLALMDRVNSSHEEVIITKRGKAVAKLIPYSDTPSKDLFGCMKGTLSIEGDIVDPLNLSLVTKDKKIIKYGKEGYVKAIGY